MPPRKRLGQLLTELGVIDEHQLQSALGHQKQWGGKLGAVLVQKGFCKEPDVVSALSKHLGMQAVKLADAKVDPRAVKFVSKQIAEKLHVFPYDLSGSGRSEVVTIAMSDPTDLSAVDQLAFHTGKRIKPMLAGDSEIVQAIQVHYGGDDKKPAPGAPGAPAAGAAAPAAPAGPEFPKRFAPPPATPAAGSPRVTPAAGTPYIPPPIPAAPPKPAQKLEEIEPDESMAAPAPPPAKPEPLELPEDDGQMMGLEPIAAHSQFGEQVAGSEELSGEGSAADSVEGLVSASVPHEGAGEAGQMEGLEPIAAHVQEPAPEGGWGQEAAPREDWTASAAGSAPSESVGWADEAPAAAPEAPPAAEAGAAQDWASGEAHGEGWGAEQQPAAEGEAGWGAEQPWAPAQEAAAPAEGGEQLPMDAIIGTAEEPAPQEWGAEGGAAEPSPEQLIEQAAAAHEGATSEAPAEEAPAPAAQEAAPQEGAHESAEAPDAWASSEDPLAGGEAAAAWGETPPETAAEAAPEAAGEAAAEAPAEAAPEAQAEAAPEAQAEAAPEAAAAAEASAGEAMAAAPPEGLPSQEVSPSTDKFAPVSPTEEAGGEHAETEAPPEWGETPAGAPQEAAAGEAAVPEPAAAAEQAAEAPPSEQFAEQGELHLEGWVAPPAEPEPQGAGWLGEALEATTPLSAADLGTLASVGVDPNDGVGALRLLAALVRVLHRRQLIDPDEVVAEIRESRTQAAQERAAAEAQSNGGPAAESSDEQQPPAEPAET